MSLLPHIFTQRFQVNSASYIEFLEAIVEPWIDSARGVSPYIFQHGSAASHKTIATWDWMTENFHDLLTANLWPSNSTNLNHLDYYAWVVVERETSSILITFLLWRLHLKPLRSTWIRSKEHLIRACNYLRTRIEEVIVAIAENSWTFIKFCSKQNPTRFTFKLFSNSVRTLYYNRICSKFL